MGGRHQDKDIDAPGAAGHRYDEVISGSCASNST